jgi:ABC-type transport system involved in multi-copper enzyme maturation permease subunit
MGPIALIVRNALRGVLYARSLYLWIIAILVVGVQLAPQIIFRDAPPNIAAFAARQQRPAPQGMSEEEQKKLQELQKKQLEFQSQQFQEQFRRQRPLALANGLRTWSFLGILFGILLGSYALSAEVTAKTIITVLARPISRWELLLGKWIAIQVFGLMSLLVGVAIHLAAGSYLSVEFSSVLWLALLHAMVAIMLYSALAMALGTVMGPLVAAAISALFYLLPDFATFLMDDKRQWVHLLGTGMHWIVPPGFKSVFVNSVDATLALDHSALSKNLVENLIYCAIFFVLGCIIFTRREVRLG